MTIKTVSKAEREKRVDELIDRHFEFAGAIEHGMEMNIPNDAGRNETLRAVVAAACSVLDARNISKGEIAAELADPYWVRVSEALTYEQIMDSHRTAD